METDITKMDINTLEGLTQSLYAGLVKTLGDKVDDLNSLLEADRELTKRELIK